jgi:hypothetical protein
MAGLVQHTTPHTSTQAHLVLWLGSPLNAGRLPLALARWWSVDTVLQGPSASCTAVVQLAGPLWLHLILAWMWGWKGGKGVV